MLFSPHPQAERLCQALSLQLVKFRLCQDEPWRAVQFCSVVLEEGQPPEKVLFWYAVRFDAPEQQDLL